MPIDSFDRTRFESALPKHKLTGAVLWESRGVIDGEYCYLLPVTAHSGLLIRSSIHTDGQSAASGKDSIRVVVVRITDLEARGSKLKGHTTRLPNWESRLTALLRRMWPMARLTEPCRQVTMDPKSREERTCPGWIWVYKCKKEGSPNKGRMFRKCSEKSCKFFQWLPEQQAKGHAN